MISSILPQHSVLTSRKIWIALFLFAQFYYVNGYSQTIKRQIGTKVIMNDSAIADSVIYSVINFDRNGLKLNSITIERDSEGKIDSTFSEFDKAGRIIRELGTNYTVKYEYDSFGSLTKTSIKSQHINLTTEYTNFYKKGKLVKSKTENATIYYKDRKTIGKFDKGFSIQRRDKNNRPFYKKVVTKGNGKRKTSIYTYQYNEKGQLIRQTSNIKGFSSIETLNFYKNDEKIDYRILKYSKPPSTEYIYYSYEYWD